MSIESMKIDTSKIKNEKVLKVLESVIIACEIGDEDENPDKVFNEFSKDIEKEDPEMYKIIKDFLSGKIPLNFSMEISDSYWERKAYEAKNKTIILLESLPSNKMYDKLREIVFNYESYEDLLLFVKEIKGKCDKSHIEILNDIHKNITWFR